MKHKIPIALVLILSLFVQPATFAKGNKVQASTEYIVENPVVREEVTKWDCIYFGSYPQNDSTGNVKEPIKWRVLSVNGNDAFLIADQNLDVYCYNSESEAVTWKDSDMRRWLNDDFYNAAFSEKEREAIKKTDVINSASNPAYGTSGGEDTEDNIYLLSIDEALNPSYGFSSNEEMSDTRISRNTAYVAAGGHTGTDDMEAAGESDFWWLRSPGDDQFFVANAEYDGAINMFGIDACSDNFAVRPVLHLDLSRNVWTRAGIVASDGENVPDNSTAAPAVTSTHIPSSAPGPSAAFDESIYRASWILDTGSDLDTIFSGTDTPAVAIHREAESSGLAVCAEGWDLLQDTLGAILDDPSGLLDEPVEKEQIYEGILFTLFEKATEITAFQGKDIVKDAVKETNSLTSLIKGLMKTKYDIDIGNAYDFSSMTAEQKEYIWDICDQYFDSKGIAKAADYISDLDEAVDYFNDAESLSEYIASCMTVMELSESYKAIMQAMQEACPDSNPALKSALCDCVTTMNMSIEAFATKTCKCTAFAYGKCFAKTMIKKFWENVKSSIVKKEPYAALIWASYKSSAYFCDKVFATSDIAERTVKLGALTDIKELAFSVYNQTKEDFKKDATKENADKYLAAVDVCYNYLNEDCDSAYKFCETVSDSFAARIQALFSTDNKADTMKQINSIKGGYENEYEILNIGWLYALQADYPEEYQNYEEIMKEWEKKYNIACPVDVYVYDKSGKLVASVIGNIPYCADDSRFTVCVVDGKKEIMLYDDAEQYTFKYVATGTGTMDVTIEENNGSSEAARTIKHVDIPLADGTTYFSQDNMASSDNTYEITETDSENHRKPVVDTADQALEQYTLTINNGYMAEGDKAGYTNSFFAGEKVTVYANMPDGGVWKGWTADTQDGIIADAKAEATTITMPARDVVLTANFETEKPQASDMPTGTPGPTGKILAEETPEPTAAAAAAQTPDHNSTPQMETKKAAPKAIPWKISAKKGRKYITIKTLKGARIVLTMNRKIIKNKKRKTRKRVIKKCRKKTIIRLSKKMRKGTKITIRITKKGYRTLTKKMVVK